MVTGDSEARTKCIPLRHPGAAVLAQGRYRIWEVAGSKYLGAWKEIDRSCRQEGHRDNGCNTSTVVSEPGEDKLVEEFFMLHAVAIPLFLGTLVNDSRLRLKKLRYS